MWSARRGWVPVDAALQQPLHSAQAHVKHNAQLSSRAHSKRRLTAKSKPKTVMPLGSMWKRISSASRLLPLLPAQDPTRMGRRGLSWGRQHGGRCTAGAAAPCLCSSRPCVTWLVSSHGCLAAARQASSWRRRTVAVDDAGQAAVRGGDDAGAVVGALQLQAPLVLLQQRPPSGVVGTWSRG